MTFAPAAYVFDLDGTLLCLPINWEQLFAEFKTIMHADTVRPLVDTLSKLDDKNRREVFDKWDRAELAIFESVTLCEQGMRLYREAEEKGKPKALVTLQGRRIVKVLIQRFHLKFDVTVTREDSLFRIDQLQMVLEDLELPARDALFVGNSENDAMAAQKIGCMFQKVS
jgi:phosphoglycolate phosphatase-like HAD superfamily hydrolase